MALPKPEPLTADGKKIPSKLKLAFSKAADINRISKFFAPEIKTRIDPKNFVVKREKPIFDATVSNGRAAFLYDPATGEAYSLTMAYHVNDNGRHKHTEIGTSITRLGGYKSAQLVVAAMALKEWWTSAPSGLVVTEILPDNVPSLKVYRDHLGWAPVTNPDKVEELARLCNEHISEEDKGRPTIWFSCNDSVLPKMAQILLDYLDDPSLRNKHTGHSVGLDLGALQMIGLTRTRLEAIAKGITDRKQIQDMETNSGPPPSPQP